MQPKNSGLSLENLGYAVNYVTSQCYCLGDRLNTLEKKLSDVKQPIAVNSIDQNAIRSIVAQYVNGAMQTSPPVAANPVVPIDMSVVGSFVQNEIKLALRPPLVVDERQVLDIVDQKLAQLTQVAPPPVSANPAVPIDIMSVVGPFVQSEIQKKIALLQTQLPAAVDEGRIAFIVDQKIAQLTQVAPPQASANPAVPTDIMSVVGPFVQSEIQKNIALFQTQPPAAVDEGRIAFIVDQKLAQLTQVAPPPVSANPAVPIDIMSVIRPEIDAIYYEIRAKDQKLVDRDNIITQTIDDIKRNLSTSQAPPQQAADASAIQPILRDIDDRINEVRTRAEKMQGEVDGILSTIHTKVDNSKDLTAATDLNNRVQQILRETGDKVNALDVKVNATLGDMSAKLKQQQDSGGIRDQLDQILAAMGEGITKNSERIVDIQNLATKNKDELGSILATIDASSGEIQKKVNEMQEKVKDIDAIEKRVNDAQAKLVLVTNMPIEQHPDVAKVKKIQQEVETTYASLTALVNVNEPLVTRAGTLEPVLESILDKAVKIDALDTRFKTEQIDNKLQNTLTTAVQIDGLVGQLDIGKLTQVENTIDRVLKTINGEVQSATGIIASMDERFKKAVEQIDILAQTSEAADNEVTTRMNVTQQTATGHLDNINRIGAEAEQLKQQIRAQSSQVNLTIGELSQSDAGLLSDELKAAKERMALTINKVYQSTDTDVININGSIDTAVAEAINKLKGAGNNYDIDTLNTAVAEAFARVKTTTDDIEKRTNEHVNSLETSIKKAVADAIGKLSVVAPNTQVPQAVVDAINDAMTRQNDLEARIRADIQRITTPIALSDDQLNQIAQPIIEPAKLEQARKRYDDAVKRVQDEIQGISEIRLPDLKLPTNVIEIILNGAEIPKPSVDNALASIRDRRAASVSDAVTEITRESRPIELSEVIGQNGETLADRIASTPIQISQDIDTAILQKRSTLSVEAANRIKSELSVPIGLSDRVVYGDGNDTTLQILINTIPTPKPEIDAAILRRRGALVAEAANRIKSELSVPIGLNDSLTTGEPLQALIDKKIDTSAVDAALDNLREKRNQVVDKRAEDVKRLTAPIAFEEISNIETVNGILDGTKDFGVVEVINNNLRDLDAKRGQAVYELSTKIYAAVFINGTEEIPGTKTKLDDYIDQAMGQQIQNTPEIERKVNIALANKTQAIDALILKLTDKDPAPQQELSNKIVELNARIAGLLAAANAPDAVKFMREIRGRLDGLEGHATNATEQARKLDARILALETTNGGTTRHDIESLIQQQFTMDQHIMKLQAQLEAYTKPSTPFSAYEQPPQLQSLPPHQVSYKPLDHAEYDRILSSAQLKNKEEVISIINLIFKITLSQVEWELIQHEGNIFLRAHWGKEPERVYWLTFIKTVEASEYKTDDLRKIEIIKDTIREDVPNIGIYFIVAELDDKLVPPKPATRRHVRRGVPRSQVPPQGAHSQPFQLVDRYEKIPLTFQYRDMVIRSLEIIAKLESSATEHWEVEWSDKNKVFALYCKINCRDFLKDMNTRLNKQLELDTETDNLIKYALGDTLTIAANNSQLIVDILQVQRKLNGLIIFQQIEPIIPALVGHWKYLATHSIFYIDVGNDTEVLNWITRLSAEDLNSRSTLTTFEKDNQKRMQDDLLQKEPQVLVSQKVNNILYTELNSRGDNDLLKPILGKYVAKYSNRNQYVYINILDLDSYFSTPQDWASLLPSDLKNVDRVYDVLETIRSIYGFFWTFDGKNVKTERLDLMDSEAMSVIGIPSSQPKDYVNEYSAQDWLHVLQNYCETNADQAGSQSVKVLYNVIRDQATLDKSGSYIYVNVAKLSDINYDQLLAIEDRVRYIQGMQYWYT
jgi:hypothetical protein